MHNDVSMTATVRVVLESEALEKNHKADCINFGLGAYAHATTGALQQQVIQLSLHQYQRSKIAAER
jgi:hypothetical protein